MTTLPSKLNLHTQSLVNRQVALRRAAPGVADDVPHLGLDAIHQIIDAAKTNRKGQRDALLIAVLFDGCLRISEAIQIRPQDICSYNGGWVIRITGAKQSRRYKPTAQDIAISASLAAWLKAYAYDKGIKPDERLFKINRFRVHQIVKAAIIKAGVIKPAGVGSVHILRHSGAIERLRRTGNPKAVQDQLRHRSALMTLRYMKTLSRQESLEIQQQVDFQW